MGEGAVFYREGKSVTANALVAKMREDGQTSRTDPRGLSGFGDDGQVGVAIHPPRGGHWAVVDSADGAQGIKSGGWSRVALIANHLATEAVWYRVYSDEIAIAARFIGGGTHLEIVPGTRSAVRAWLRAQGLPLGEAVPPAAAGADATVVAIQYESAVYRSGPDAEVAARLVAIASALRRADPDRLVDLCRELAPEQLPLALAVIRGARSGHWLRCLEAVASGILAGPMIARTAVKEPTFEEEVLRRVAAAGVQFDACLERLDAIEREAEARSSWAGPTGVAALAVHFFQSHPARSLECYRRLLARGDKPSWWTVNHALAALLASVRGPIALAGAAAEVVRRAEARVGALGDTARDAVHYNLACVHARARDHQRALAHLTRCVNLRAQNPHPETDPDLAGLRGLPAFAALLGAPAGPAEADGDDEDDVEEPGDEEKEDDDDEVGHTAPAERAVFRQAIRFRRGSDSALTSRMGGLPNAPSVDTPWPESRKRPMAFIMQLVSTAAGGEVDLGDVTVLQVFADLEGDYYDPSYHAVVLHRVPCPVTLAAPVGVDVAPIRLIELTDGHDDRVLLDVDFPDDDDPLHDVHAVARRHAWADKLWGIPVGANLQPDQRDSRGQPMRCLLQLVTYDDWFLWYVFAASDLSEARLQIVRG